jgi:two-component system nitrate/nitrite response regulator NarL
MRAVVIDDSAGVRTRLSALLRESGVAVIGEAKNGQEGLRLVQDLTPDVVVLDLRMPGLSGLDVLRQLQSLQSPPRVVVLTNNATERHRIECIRLGAAECLDKSNDLDRIVTVLRGVTERSQLLSESDGKKGPTH